MPKVNDWGKLIVQVSIVACATALALAGILSGDAAVGLFLLVMGYTVGNGVSAVTRQPPSPMLVPVLEQVGPGTRNSTRDELPRVLPDDGADHDGPAPVEDVTR